MTSVIYGWRVLWLLTVLDGAVRKWLLPDWQTAVFLLKDVLLLVLACMALFVQGRAVSRISTMLASRYSAFTAMFLIYFLICVTQVVNPRLPDPALGLWGLKSHVSYAVLILLTPVVYVTRPDQLAWDLKFLIVSGIGVAILAVIQFNSPIDAAINKYAVNVNERIALFGEEGNVRITGTFAYISGMAVFAYMVGALATTSIMFDRVPIVPRALLFVTIGLMLAASIMTGSRWALYVWATAVPGLVVALSWRGVRGRTLATLGTILLVGLASAFLFESAFEAFLQRAMSAGDDEVRLARMTLGFGDFIEEAGLVGFGIGATHQGAPVILGGDASYWWIRPLIMEEFEDESSRVMVELGFIGFLVWACMRILSLVMAFRIMKMTRRSDGYSLAVWVAMIMIGLLTSSVIFNVTASFFFWYGLGLLLYMDVVHHKMQARASGARIGA